MKKEEGTYWTDLSLSLYSLWKNERDDEMLERFIVIVSFRAIIGFFINSNPDLANVLYTLSNYREERESQLEANCGLIWQW